MGTQNGKVTAYVLIEVPAKHSGGVTEAARGIPGVVEASAIFGMYDVMVKVQGATYTEVEHLIMGKLQNLPQVKVTRTFFVVGSI